MRSDISSERGRTRLDVEALVTEILGGGPDREATEGDGAEPGTAIIPAIAAPNAVSSAEAPVCSRNIVSFGSVNDVHKRTYRKY